MTPKQAPLGGWVGAPVTDLPPPPWRRLLSPFGASRLGKKVSGGRRRRAEERAGENPVDAQAQDGRRARRACTDVHRCAPPVGGGRRLSCSTPGTSFGPTQNSSRGSWCLRAPQVTEALPCRRVLGSAERHVRSLRLHHASGSAGPDVLLIEGPVVSPFSVYLSNFPKMTSAAWT